MKKTRILLLLVLLLLVVTPALAETQTVVLGDGAPIPYFNGFESSLICDLAAIRGITGKLEGSFELNSMGGANTPVSRTITLQNIAVTDDFYAVFFQMTYDASISFPIGQSQFLSSQMVPSILIQQEGSLVSAASVSFSEAHLINDRELQCVAVASMKEPITSSKELKIWMSDISFILDRSLLKDPTVSYSPMLVIKSNPLAQPGDKGYNLSTTIRRIAFTPFGMRIVTDNQETGSGPDFSYQVADKSGRLLSPSAVQWSSSNTASPEHPAITRSEMWFAKNNVQEAIQLIPKRWVGEEEIYPKYYRTAYVPLDSLPANIPLEGRGMLHIESADLTPDGFLVSYTIDGLNDYLSFDLADANNESLHFNFVSFDSVNFAKDLLQEGGYWSNEYKGRQVSYVTAEDLQKVKTLEISYYTGLWEFVCDQAVVIPLVP